MRVRVAFSSESFLFSFSFFFFFAFQFLSQNGIIADWNRLLEGAIGTSPDKTHIFRKKVREVIISEVK
jgi:hypothetical protein